MSTLQHSIKLNCCHRYSSLFFLVVVSRTIRVEKEKMASGNENGENVDELREIFDLYDINRDGIISVKVSSSIIKLLFVFSSIVFVVARWLVRICSV